MSSEEAQEYLERLIAQTQDAEIFSAEIRQRVYEAAGANPYVMQWVVAQIDAAQEPHVVLEELTQGEGDVDERVFDRSFNLPQLGDDGRAALLALSLFVPSATLGALAEVAGFDHDLKRVREAVKNLRALWLIKGLDGNQRFTIEGLTRSLARARLLKDDRAEEFRRRFVVHFLRYAEAHAQPTPEDYDALEAEKDNVLGAMDVAFAIEDWLSVIAIAEVLVNPVRGMLGMHDYWDEAIRHGEQAVVAAQAVEDEQAVAMFATHAATIRMKRGEYDKAGQTYQQALVASKKLGSEANVAACLHMLGNLAQDQGELAEAQRLYDESLEIKRQLGDQSGIAITLHQLGRIAEDQGDFADARRLYGESLGISMTLGSQSSIARSLGQLGILAEKEGNRGEAIRLTRQAFVIFEKLKSPDAEIARRNLEQLGAEAS